LATRGEAFAASNSAMSTTMAAASGAIGSMLLGILRGWIVGDKHSFDAVAIGNGILAGLVAITAGADVIRGDLSLVVGVGGSVAYFLGSTMSEALQLDDVVEAWAVHGGCGIWGTIAVGLFHPELGLMTQGSWGLLSTQLIGIIAIFTISVGTVLPVALALSYFGMLRVGFEEEARGLDYKFGNAASSYIMNKNQRLRACFLTLDAYGCSIDDTILALKSLKHVIQLPFSPQASENLIEAQVADIISRCDVAPADVEKNFLAFLSHHKADAGDAARVFCDTAKRLMEQAVTSADKDAEAGHFVALMALAGKDPSRNSRKGSQTSLGVELGEVGRAVMAGDDSPANTKIFLDSNDLTNLSKLISHVEKSVNHILLLSRATLERPYVLAELVYAYKQRKRILCVRANWPGDEQDVNSKAFMFPQMLNEAIGDWEDVAYFQRARTGLQTDATSNPFETALHALRALVAPLVGCIRGYRADELFQKLRDDEDVNVANDKVGNDERAWQKSGRAPVATIAGVPLPQPQTHELGAARALPPKQKQEGSYRASLEA